MFKHQPNIVSVLGCTHTAIDVVLRKVFNHNTCPGTILVLDYTGRGSVVLTESNKMSMLNKKIHWFDLDNKRHTSKLLEINNSNNIKNMLERIFGLFKEVSNVMITQESIEYTINTTIKFAENGNIQLSNLLKMFTLPEIKQLYLESKLNQEEIISLQNMLSWVLRFPAIFSISNGINPIKLGNYFADKTVIWFELLYEHLERVEHHLLCGIIDIIVENSLNNFYYNNPNSKLDFTVLHIYPPQKSFSNLPVWIKEPYKNVRHISIHNFLPNIPIRKITNEWIDASENVWIVGKLDTLKRDVHKNWLTDTEMNLIDNLENGKVWVKSMKSGKAIIANVKTDTNILNLAYQFRLLSNKNRKITSLYQMSSEVDRFVTKSNGIIGLYNKLCNKDFLRLGWFRVKEGKKDSHGIDKVSIKEFGDNIEHELNVLQYELKTKKYRCRPLQRIYIEKSEGGLREIGSACIRDRVVMTSCLILIEPFFEPTFSNYSFAYRPRRNAHQAINVLRSRIQTGFDWAVIADIEKCFDTIDHNLLLEFIERKISDTDLLNLFKHWLDIDVFEFNELVPTITGVPQGESLSPLFANIYLDSLDKHFEKLGLLYVRYADDIIIQTKTKYDAERGLYVLKNFLIEPLHLEIKPSKTNIASVEDGIEFLGFQINKNTIQIRNKKLTNVFEILENYIKILGNKSATIFDINKTFLKINATIRGFRNYFLLQGETTIKEQLKLLDGHIEELGVTYLPLEISADPAWLSRERFSRSSNNEEFDSYEEEMTVKSKTENGYPIEKVTNNYPSGLIKDLIDDKASIIIEDNTIEDEANMRIKDTVFEIDKRLYIMAHGSYISHEEDFIVVKKRKKEIARYKIDDLGLLFLQGSGMNISVNLQLKLAELGIPIVFTPIMGYPLAVLNSILSSKARLRKLQIIRRDDEDVIKTGLNMLVAKVSNQTSVLKYFFKYNKRKESSSFIQIKKDINSMNEIAEMIGNLDIVNKEIRTTAMGYEGHAASIYWQNIKHLLPHDFEFTGRIARYAKDIVNQCFNYVYSLLYGEVWRAVIKNGLDPYFGFIHGSQRDSGSLIFDIIEEFRAPFADRIVISMFGRGFRPSINNSGLLKTNSKKQLAKSFSKRWHKKFEWRSITRSASQILEHQANSISKLLTNEGIYVPYKMKW